MVLCPRCDPDGLSSLFCVFDGTCGDHASDFAQKNFMNYLLQYPVSASHLLVVTERSLCW
jgi:serine/threonine protein phosphatase PrpC